MGWVEKDKDKVSLLLWFNFLIGKLPCDRIKASAPEWTPSCSYSMRVDVVKTKNLKKYQLPIVKDDNSHTAPANKKTRKRLWITKEY